MKEVCFQKLLKIVVNSKQEFVKPKTGFFGGKAPLVPITPCLLIKSLSHREKKYRKRGKRVAMLYAGGKGANTKDNKRALFVITNSFVKFKFVELSEEFESRLFSFF
jgi:hypothetical protein